MKYYSLFYAGQKVLLYEHEVVEVIEAKAKGKEIVRIRDIFIPLDRWPLIMPDEEMNKEAAHETSKGYGDGNNLLPSANPVVVEMLDQLKGKLYEKMSLSSASNAEKIIYKPLI